MTLAGGVTKQTGACPFCKAQIEAIVVESNTIRRDRCTCPSCKQPILVCRTPSCHDYAKGTETWDHEFCPDCTQKAGEVSSQTLSAVGTFAKDLSKELAKGVAPAIVAAIIVKKVAD